MEFTTLKPIGFSEQRIRRKIVAFVLLCVLGSLGGAVFAAQGELLSVTFNRGYIGQVGSNTQDITNIKRTETCGISSVSFDQLDTDGDGEFNIPETATKDQGNDFPGQLTFNYVEDGVEEQESIQVNVTWREGANPLLAIGFVPSRINT